MFTSRQCAKNMVLLKMMILKYISEVFNADSVLIKGPAVL